jgi:hypothetical protein
MRVITETITETPAAEIIWKAAALLRGQGLPLGAVVMLHRLPATPAIAPTATPLLPRGMPIIPTVLMLIIAARPDLPLAEPMPMARSTHTTLEGLFSIMGSAMRVTRVTTRSITLRLPPTVRLLCCFWLVRALA